MTEWRQPWRRVDLDGCRCHLQILDPATAFEVEPQLIEALGNATAMVAAAPDEVLGAVWRHSVPAGARAEDLAELIRDPVAGPEMAAVSIAALGRTLAACLIEARLDHGFVRRMFETLILGRLKVEGRLLEDARDWTSTRFAPLTKWQAMGVQLRQTFGPLWTRSPYHVSSRRHDYNVPQPKAVPVAVRWADNLARLGSAASSREILREWTPVEMIEVVENAAYQAEYEHRAHEAAKAGER